MALQMENMENNFNKTKETLVHNAAKGFKSPHQYLNWPTRDYPQELGAIPWALGAIPGS